MQDRRDTFLDRLEKVRTALGGSMVKTAEFTRISRPLIYAIRDKRAPVSDDSIKKLDDAERRLKTRLETPQATADEDQAPYAPARPPTSARAHLEAQFARLLDRAERIEGGMGWVQVQLGLHLGEEQLLKLDPTYDPVEELKRLLAEREAGAGDAGPDQRAV